MNLFSKDILRFFRSGLLFGFGISVAIGISFGVYAAYSTLTAATNEPLTKDKWNELVTYLVPPGTIIAYTGVTCPNTWAEYIPARGRFLRGIDPSGTVDPDGLSRTIGGTQEDALKDHLHYIKQIGAINISGGTMNIYWPNGGFADGTSGPSIYSTSETRPKNVAVLFCIKS